MRASFLLSVVTILPASRALRKPRIPLISARKGGGSVNLPTPTSVPPPVFDGKVIDRAQGCLFGQFIGDALGTRYEFRREQEVRKKIEKDREKDGFLPILGGGPFQLEAGQVTDDTELAMALAFSILEKGGGDYNQAGAAAYYREWLDSGPFDIGTATRLAFSVPPAIQDDTQVRDVILKNAARHNAKSLSNGCLMRASPLAIAEYDKSEAERVTHAVSDARLTNPSIHTQVAVAAYVEALACLIRGGTPQEAFDAASKFAAGTASTRVKRLLRAAEQDLVEVALHDNDEDDQLSSSSSSPSSSAEYDGRHMGYFGVAFQWAFAQLLHAPSFEGGLVTVISRGGDTDTNGCICGALLGARFGVAQIPRRYLDTVSKCKQKRVDTYPWVDSTNIPNVTLSLLGNKKTPHGCSTPR